MENIEIVMPQGMLGVDGDDYLLDSAIRAIAEKYGEEGEWATKYGTNYENDVFMMHRYCWCDGEDCPWCVGGGDPAPNFHYKSLDLKVWWYKYIGRDMKMNKKFDNLQISKMLLDCFGEGYRLSW